MLSCLPLHLSESTPPHHQAVALIGHLPVAETDDARDEDDTVSSQADVTEDETAWLRKETTYVNDRCAHAQDELLVRLQTAEGKAVLKAAAKRSRKERKRREAAYLQIEDVAERERRRLRDRFDMYDMDGSGDIDMHEFKLILSEKLNEQADANRNAEIILKIAKFSVSWSH